ncbi:peptide-N-glycosidase F-related protein [Edaphocola aurantiacus]|uniref:peptide-N-glycosidase F-related protein n=1 Tax=Edaphocola aurantiacus TaxID=2601682 RepID=UPI001C958C15|nr:peptide-N-glycosidase F-related protein [Edaphocola aurantiacus]
MKKILCNLLAIAGLGISAHAATGDTTVVQAHNEKQLQTYTNYDTTITFPNGSLSYQKIIMDFTLGKYNCGGSYNPATAGETSQGKSGWCSDWDYDLHIIVMTAAGDTLELGEVITPYANTTLPMFPWTWKRNYRYDITDLYPILKNGATIRIFYAGWSGGFTGTTKFSFIEGTPPREVLGVQSLWQSPGSGFSYGEAVSIDSQIVKRTLTAPAGTTAATVRTIMSGHGFGNQAYCSEFCSKWYRLMVNNQNVEQKSIWKPSCGSNQAYPQSGTWVYDRANWCPGEHVEPYWQSVPVSALSAPFTVDLDFQPYTNVGTTSNPGAWYKLSSAIIFYGDYNRQKDVGVEHIISPTTDANEYRNNPICGSPKIVVKNYGSETATSIKFEYGVAGGTMSTYTYTTSLAANASAEVNLPSLASLQTAAANSIFVVKVLSVNNATDENPDNNELKSEFVPSPEWTGGNFSIQLKTSGAVSGQQNRTDWKIIDIATGNVVASRNGIANSTTYNDTVHLANGCYRLELDCSTLGAGLRNPYLISSAGTFIVRNLGTNQRITLDKNRDGQTSAYQGNLEGWMGNGFTQYFTVTGSTSVLKVENDINLNMYPNPAMDVLHIRVDGLSIQKGTVTLTNAIGQAVYTAEMKGNDFTLNTEAFPSGIYTLTYSSDKGSRVEKVSIKH